jgi:hypothetical protein
LVKVGLVQRERFLDPQRRAPQHDDQRAGAQPVAAVPGSAHDRDDLIDGRRIGRKRAALVVGLAAGVVAGQRRPRPATASGIEQRQ